MITENEAHLLQRFIQRGDAEAFAQITRRHADMVYGTCLRITANQEAAADAAQDTFFEFLKNARRITGSLGGWLHQVATRRAIDLVRRDRARRQREQAYAAQAALETDHWADVSPLVDEAISELDAPSREVLIGHFLQGQTTVQMAAAQGVAQSTVSRHIERALEHLRDKLRAKGVLVAVTTLSALMSQAAQTAPVSVLVELGKMAVATSGTAAGTSAATALAGVKAKLAAAAIVATLGVGGYVAYKHRQAERSQNVAVRPAAPSDLPTSEPTAAPANVAGPLVAEGSSPAAAERTARSGPPQGSAAPQAPAPPMGGVLATGNPTPAAQPMGFGGFGTRVATAPSPTSPLGAVHRFATELRRGDMSRLAQCFVPGSAEVAGFKRLLENPQNDEERSMKQCLESLGQPVEIVETTPWVDGLKVRWKATVRKPFSLVEEGTLKNWQEGDKFDLEVRLKKVGEDWRIAGF